MPQVCKSLRAAQRDDPYVVRFLACRPRQTEPMAATNAPRNPLPAAMAPPLAKTPGA